MCIDHIYNKYSLYIMCISQLSFVTLLKSESPYQPCGDGSASFQGWLQRRHTSHNGHGPTVCGR